MPGKEYQVAEIKREKAHPQYELKKKRLRKRQTILEFEYLKWHCGDCYNLPCSSSGQDQEKCLQVSEANLTQCEPAFSHNGGC